MKHKIMIRVLSLLLLAALLVGCASQPKRDIYATMDDIDVLEYSAADIMVTSYKAPSQYTDRFPDEYATLAAYGEEGVTYILEYVIERKGLDYCNAMFFVCCAYQILGMNEFLNISMWNPVEHARALQKYLP